MIGFPSRHILLLRGAFLALVVSPASLNASDLFSDDFESYAPDTNLTTSGPWSFLGSAAVLFVRDDLTATPFGASNQYLGWEDEDASASPKAQSGNIAAISGGITTLSFDFHEPSTGGNGDFLFGFAQEGLDLNSGGSYLGLKLDDGTIGVSVGSWVTTGTTSYTLDTSYTIYVVLNDTATDVTDYYDSRTLAAGTADLWLETLGSGTPIFVATATPGGLHTASFRVTLRSFTTALQTMLVDNVCLETGIGGPMNAALPPVIPPSGQPQSQTVVAGTGLIYLTVEPGGDPPFTYQWKLGVNDIPGATDPTLSIDTPDAGDAGDYTVVVTNAQGSTTSDPATVTLTTGTSALIENFDSYATGFLENAGSDWDVSITGYYSVTDGGSGNNYLGCLDDDGAGTAPSLKPLGANEIADGDTSTFFSKVYRDSNADSSLWFGLTDSLTGGYNAFEGYITFGNTGTINIRDGGGGANATATLAADTWHNFWVIHNNETDTVQVFMTTEDRDATLADRLESSTGQFEFGFRNGTGNPITYVQAINRTTTGPWRVDDFYMSPLANLAYPVPASPFSTYIGGFPGATDDPLANDDGDNLVNALEFAFGLNPLVADAVPLVVSPAAPGAPTTEVTFRPLAFKAQFVRRTGPAVTYTAQFSNDLNNFEDNNDTANPPVWVVDIDGNYEIVAINYPIVLSNGKKARYFRVKVVLN